MAARTAVGFSTAIGLRPGQRVVCMGPTGAPTEIPVGENVVLCGGGLGNAVLFSIARALRERKNRVLYFAGFKRGEDLFKREEIEAASDAVVWCTEAGTEVTPSRPQDRWFRGNVVQALLAYAQDKLGDSLYFLKDQLLAAGVGLVAMAMAMKIGWRKLARLAYPLLLLSVVLLVLVMIPGIGAEVNGARRWIRLPGLRLQPAELVKLGWVIYLSYSLAKKREKVATFSVGFLPHLLLCGLLVGLCMLQPDFGSSMVLLALLWVMLFCAGVQMRWLVGSVFAAAPLVAVLVMRTRMLRHRLAVPAAGRLQVFRSARSWKRTR